MNFYDPPSHLDPPAVDLVKQLHPDKGVEEEGEPILCVELLSLLVLGVHPSGRFVELSVPEARRAQVDVREVVVVEAKRVDLDVGDVYVGRWPGGVDKTLGQGFEQGAGRSAAELDSIREATLEHDSTVPCSVRASDSRGVGDIEHPIQAARIALWDLELVGHIARAVHRVIL